MGSRANFVILGDQGLELYYDHWGAQGMSYDLLLTGPAATVSRIRSMRRLDNLPEEWLDDTWAEGALVLDLGAQRVIWFEVAYEGMPPYLTAHFIERTWPGWTAIWAAEGMSAILAAVGVDAAPILGEAQKNRRDENALDLLDTAVESWHTELGQVLRSEREALIRSAERRRDENPTASTSTALREGGHDVELSPWAEEYVPISEKSNLDVVLREIDSLIDSGATRLPATR